MTNILISKANFDSEQGMDNLREVILALGNPSPLIPQLTGYYENDDEILISFGDAAILDVQALMISVLEYDLMEGGIFDPNSSAITFATVDDDLNVLALYTRVNPDVQEGCDCPPGTCVNSPEDDNSLDTFFRNLLGVG